MEVIVECVDGPLDGYVTGFKSNPDWGDVQITDVVIRNRENGRKYLYRPHALQHCDPAPNTPGHIRLQFMGNG